MPLKTHKFRGLRYRIIDGHYDGFAEIPGIEMRGLYVDSNMRGQRQHLETVIHEAMHAEDKDESEQVITRRAKSIARFVWRFGYRLEGEEKCRTD